ncbi:Flagellar protein FlhE [compost metagenome]
MRRRLALGLLLALGVPSVPAEALAPGSWHADLGSLRVALAGRETGSTAALPPPLAAGRSLDRVRWQFRLPPGARVQAWLCHPQRCIELHQAQGRTRALAGLDAGQPLQLRFRLPPAAPAQLLQELQLLVEYR